MAIFPTAYYVHILDGVPGRLRIATNTANGLIYQPGVVNQHIFTRNFAADDGAVMEAVAAAPSPSTATWQQSATSIVYNASDKTLDVVFNGILPAMPAGIQPCGWVFTERAWQITAREAYTPVGATPMVTPYAFTSQNAPNDANGIPSNVLPVYFIPFFRVGIASYDRTGPSQIIVGGTATNEITAFTLTKPLNPQQGVGSPVFTTYGDNETGILTLPEVVRAGCSVVFEQNVYGQITKLIITVPFSLAPAGTIIAGATYGVRLELFHPLTYLKGDQIVTENVPILNYPMLSTIATSQVGPTISAGSVMSGPDGYTYSSPQQGAMACMGTLDVDFTATHPNGVSLSGVYLATNDGSVSPDTIPALSVVSMGGDTYRARFDTRQAESLLFNYPVPPLGNGAARWAAFNHTPLRLYMKSAAATPVYSSASLAFPPFFVNQLPMPSQMLFGTPYISNSSPLTPAYIGGLPSYTLLSIIWMRIPVPMPLIRHIRVKLVRDSTGRVLSDNVIAYTPNAQVPFGTEDYPAYLSDQITPAAYHFLRNSFDDLSVDVGLGISDPNSDLSYVIPRANSSSLTLELTVTDRSLTVRTYTAQFYVKSLYEISDGGGGGGDPKDPDLLQPT